MKKIILSSIAISMIAFAVNAQTSTQQLNAQTPVGKTCCHNKKDAKSCSDKAKAKTACASMSDAKVDEKKENNKSTQVKENK